MIDWLNGIDETFLIAAHVATKMSSICSLVLEQHVAQAIINHYIQSEGAAQELCSNEELFDWFAAQWGCYSWLLKHHCNSDPLHFHTFIATQSAANVKGDCGQCDVQCYWKHWIACRTVTACSRWVCAAAAADATAAAAGGPHRYIRRSVLNAVKSSSISQGGGLKKRVVSTVRVLIYEWILFILQCCK